jgi:hypothetical protein
LPPKAQASPCTETILRSGLRSEPPLGEPTGVENSPENIYSAQHDPIQMATPPTACAVADGSIRSGSFTAPLNPRHPTVGALVPMQGQLSRSDTRPNDGTRDPSEDKP